MPWIPPEICEAAVYLYPSEAEAEDGVHLGGSGFMIGIPVGPAASNSHVYCVVTNKHVIRDGNAVVRVNTRLGGVDILALDSETWYFHPEGDDVAVCPVLLSALHKFSFIPIGMCLTKEVVEDYAIGPGDDVFMVGRFINHEGRQQNLPTARFGNIAQMPWEPIVVDGFPQESFLVEARSLAGYSGAPIFVYLPPQSELPAKAVDLMRNTNAGLLGWSHKRAHIRITVGPWLLGIDHCHLRWDEPIWSRQKGDREPVNPDWYVRTNTGMVGAVPAWKLLDVIHGAEMKPVVDAAEEAVAKIKDAPVDLDVAALAKQVREDAEQFGPAEAEQRFEATLRGAIARPRRPILTSAEKPKDK